MGPCNYWSIGLLLVLVTQSAYADDEERVHVRLANASPIVGEFYYDHEIEESMTKDV